MPTAKAERHHFDWRLEACVLMEEVVRLQRVVAGQQMRPYGLTHIQWLALVRLRAHERLTQIGLAEHLAISRPACTALIDRLASRGLVERRNDLADRRIKWLHVTEKAEQVMDGVNAVASRLQRTMFQKTSETEGRRLIELLSGMKQEMDAIGGAEA